MDELRTKPYGKPHVQGRSEVSAAVRIHTHHRPLHQSTQYHSAVKLVGPYVSTGGVQLRADACIVRAVASVLQSLIASSLHTASCV